MFVTVVAPFMMPILRLLGVLLAAGKDGSNFYAGVVNEAMNIRRANNVVSKLHYRAAKSLCMAFHTLGRHMYLSNSVNTVAMVVGFHSNRAEITNFNRHVKFCGIEP